MSLSAPKANRQIGLLGGTFDPPTTAHIALAEHALEQLGLDEVILIPAANPYQKRPMASSADRLAMCLVAVERHPRLSVSAIELLRDGPTYTIDTLTELLMRYFDVDFMFLIGEDVDMSTWEKEAECKALANFVRVARKGLRVHNGFDVDLGVPAGCSTEARTAIVADGHSDLVDPAVARYIEWAGVYRPTLGMAA